MAQPSLGYIGVGTLTTTDERITDKHSESYKKMRERAYELYRDAGAENMSLKTREGEAIFLAMNLALAQNKFEKLYEAAREYMAKHPCPSTNCDNGNEVIGPIMTMRDCPTCGGAGTMLAAYDNQQREVVGTVGSYK